MDLEALKIQLATIIANNGASIIQDKIKSIRITKDLEKRSSQYEEIINSLLKDKNDLSRIATAYEQELTLQQISDQDIEFISNNIIPLIEQLMPNNSAQIEVIKSLLSKETLRILQLIGFNYKIAIGEPLTNLVHDKISNLSATKATK